MPRRMTLVLLIAALSVALTGAAYQAAGSARDRRQYPPPGRMVDVGGYRLHLWCTGVGAPTVILDARFFNATYWYGVQPHVASFTRVCSYDHGGLGWSDSAPAPRTSARLMTELHTALHNAQIAPPYVLVADSQSQFDARVYHAQYPDELVGVVLTDGVPDDFSDRMDVLKLTAFDALVEASARFSRLQRLLGPFGLARAQGWCRPGVEVPGTLPPYMPRIPLPPRVAATEEALNCRTGWAHAIELEGDSFEENLREARAAGTFGHLPLIVVSRDPEVPVDPDWGAVLSAAYVPLWNAMQPTLLHLSSRSGQMIASQSNHRIAWDRPDIVVEAIRAVIGSADGSEPSAANSSRRTLQ